MASLADLALPMPMAGPEAPAAASNTTGEPDHQAGQSSVAGPSGTAKQHPGKHEPRPAGSHPKKRKPMVEEELVPMDEVMLKRLTVIKEGDNVLLRLPSDQVKAVVATKDGLVSLGKFGAFPCAELLGRDYDITYEITPINPESEDRNPLTGKGEGSAAAFGQGKGKKNKKQKKEEEAAAAELDNKVRSNPGWGYTLKPLKRQTVSDAVLDDITETNEFIDDTDAVQQAMMTQEEIQEMRASGATAEEIMDAQLKRHERFDLKTDFSKEKWRKRKERKYLQSIHPIAPSAYNIAKHQFARLPQSILHLRDDTLSQLLSLSNVRPGGRYMVVDDTGGLVTAAILERMGCVGRVMTFTDADSPPAWGVLNTMNFSERELACCKWLNWFQAEESWAPQPLPDESGLPDIAAHKKFQRERKHQFQLNDLNATRDELHRGGWDGLILATELNPLSVLARLTPYLGGSSNIVVYSSHLPVLAEVLVYARSSSIYLNPTLTESWTRTYQVLPGRTHPLMSTSSTGGYLISMTRVFENGVNTRTFHYDRLKKNKNANKAGKKKAAGQTAGANDASEEAEPSGTGTIADEGQADARSRQGETPGRLTDEAEGDVDLL